MFVTAFDQYALQAFEMSCARLPAQAVQRRSASSRRCRTRAQQLAQRQATTIGRQLLEILPGHAARREPVGDRLVVKSSGRIYFVRIADIDWCEAAGNYVRCTSASSRT